MRWLALMLVMASCLEPRLVPCADGRLCPRGTLCDDAHASCVAPEQLSACEGAADLTPCGAAMPDGACFDGVCLPRICGNGHVDLGEQCDDGNRVDLDDCSADCRSTEVCGNGVIDLLRGEACDDGNLGGHDGCDSRCGLEHSTWRVLDAGRPPARTRAMMAYDSARHRLLMFGGSGPSGPLGDTWESDGRSWIMRTPTHAPIRRSLGGAAYDARMGGVLVFGGVGEGNAFGDTWMWNGDDWREMSPVIGPGPRLAPMMAYDSARQRVVLHGGLFFFPAATNDTWEWDGVGWSERSPMTPPAARVNQAFAYDATTGRCVMFGAIDDGSWTWDGTEWQVAPVSFGTARTGSGAAYVPELSGGSLYLFGGDSNVGASPTLDQLLAYRNGAWSIVATSPRPPARRGGVAAGDARTQRLVVFGGETGAAQLLDDTWAYVRGSGWTEINVPARPLPRLEAAMVYDRDAGVTWMFGGRDATPTAPSGPSSFLGDTWRFSELSWQRVATTGPGARRGHAMVYDSVRRVTLLFGGESPSGWVGDLWEWNGVVWTRRVTATSPSPRANAALAYDPLRRRVVMFGGEGANGKLGDTWEFDGSAWLQTSSGGPSSRSRAAMSYDATTGIVLLFGGENGDTPLPLKLKDTWTWDGASWTSPAVPGPPERSDAAMVYDTRRSHIVLHGGRRLFGVSDTWEWDGHAWLRVPTIATTVVSGGNGAAYDELEGRLIVLDSSPTAQTFELVWIGATAPDACAAFDTDGDGLAGCADLDCRGRCGEACVPSDPGCDPASRRCGDGRCDGLEDCRICPTDCSLGNGCVTTCGDFVCDPGEVCPGDCP